MLGVWSAYDNFVYVVTTPHDKEALNYQGKVITREAPCGLYDVIYRQENVTTSSMRPIVHPVLDRELTLLAEIRLQLELQGIPQRCIKQS